MIANIFRVSNIKTQFLKNNDVILTKGNHIFIITIQSSGLIHKQENNGIQWRSDGTSLLDTSFDVKEVLGNGREFFNKITIDIKLPH
jgi:hypothetical protein